MEIKHEFGRVAVLYGGASSERIVSLASGEAVLKALQEMQIDHIAIDASGRELIEVLLKNKIDLCLIMLHGDEGENGHVQSILEMLKIPYTGSDALACALTMNKMLIKQIWKANHLPTPKSQILSAELPTGEIDYPCAIKPIDQGSSIGVSKVCHQHELKMAYDKARSYGSVMMESWITGKEITVPIVNHVVLPSVWIEAPDVFYDFNAKFIEGATYHCPSMLSQSLEQKIQSLAKKAYDLAGCKGWARVDFIVSDQGEPYLIEINTVPGMTKLSLVPLAAEVYGWDFNQLVVEILKTAQSKQVKKKPLLCV